MNDMQKGLIMSVIEPYLDRFMGINNTAAPSIFNSSSREYSDPLTVESIDNHIYFYSEINSDRGLALIQKIRNIDNDLRNEHLNRDLPEDYPLTPIWLHIQSGGGQLFAGLAISDQLKRIKSPIFSVVEGYCASAATLLSMSCTRRFIQPSAFMLIHQLSGMAWGTHQQMQDDMHLQEMLMNLLYQFYESHTSLSKEQLEQYLSRDSWFDANESLNLRFVDEII